MILIRELDKFNDEWLIVHDNEVTNKDILKLYWDDDLIVWMDAHQKEIDKGDFTIFYEYWRLQKSNLR